ncbi:MAG: cadherin-like domain-containing protein [Novosphingobium sp.]|nr:cadherin-like domain-containing protein [Novosphingobium sp.]
MSKSVVPAAGVAHAKHLVSNKKLIKRPEARKSAEDEQQASDHKDADAHAVQTANAQNHELSMSEAPLGTFSFASALADAAAGTAALAVETSAQDDDGSMGEERDGSGPILLVAAGGLAIAGGVAAFSGGGGSKNQAPTAAATQAITTDEDTPKAGNVSATDPDGDVLTYAVTTQGSKGSAAITSTGAFTYTPNPDANGSDSFTVTVTDPKGLTVTQTVNVTINPVNDAPRAGNDNTTSLTVAEDTSGVVVISFTDPENDPISFTVDAGPNHGTFALVDGENVYTPAPDYNGNDSITITVSDDKGGSTTYTIAITVTPVNDAPVADASQDVSTVEGASLAVVVDATDVDGDELAYSVEEGDGPAHGTVTGGEGGHFTYVPAADFVGEDSFTVTIDDGNGGTITQIVSVTVDPASISLDVGKASDAAPVSFNAAGGDFVYTDDAAVETHVLLAGFGAGDFIHVTGADGKYSFGTTGDGNDLLIYGSAADVGKDNIIIIEDILVNPGFVTDYASAVIAAGYQFMDFA